MEAIYLCRHGETDWTLSGQHTGTTDLALTETGKKQAASLKTKIQEVSFSLVLSSPMHRAMDTCLLSGFPHFQTDPDLAEWNYGDYEGMTTKEIQKKNPSWNLFSDGVPNGESLQDVSERADRLLQKLGAHKGNIALFSHGHFSRVIAARWLGLPAANGRLFTLSVASISILGFERLQPVIKLWNETNSCGKNTPIR